MTLNFGDILDRIGPELGHKPAVVHDNGVITWSDFDKRTNALAHHCVNVGLKPGDRIAFFLFNGPDYFEWLAASFKARMAHANINYRYVASEVAQLVADSGAKILVYDHRLAPVVDGLDGGIIKDCSLVQVGGVSPAVEGATLAADLTSETAIGSPLSEPLNIERTYDDPIFIYTGGTTGYPKGVVWQTGAMAEVIFGAELAGQAATTDAVVNLVRTEGRAKPYSIGMTASPLMHGAALWMAITMMCNGDTAVVCDNADGFDAERHLDLIEQHKVEGIIVVGDSFARPLIDAMKLRPSSARSLKIIGSTGAIWSAPVKQELLELVPNVVLLDLLASSEAASIASSATTAAGGSETAKFMLGPNCQVFDENDQIVAPGSDTQGFLAVGGPQPLRYHNDPEKTARTFRIIDGVRYSFAGDMCTVAADGTIHLLGRGSNCINTGGEKVFPEEVEEAIKTHQDVADALVLGIPDEKWGQAVVACVELLPTDDGVGTETIRTYLRDGRLASYKIPKQIEFAKTMPRKANGKADYAAVRSLFGIHE